MSEETKIKRKWSTRRKVLVAFLILWGVTWAVIGPGLFWQLHEANKALHGFGDALIAKQYEQAYGLTSQAFRASTDYPTFVKVHNSLTQRLGDLKSVEVNNSEVKNESDGWHGTIETRMVFARGSLSFVFILKKKDRSWKIYSYHEQ